VFVAITQGAQFIGLDLMDAIPVSMLLNLTPIVVLGLGVIMLKEIPTRAQSVLVFLVVIGAMIYFYPIDLDLSETVGLIVVLIGVIANAFSSIMGRSINRERNTPPIVVTGVSMAIGAVILLIIGVVLEGLTVVSHADSSSRGYHCDKQYNVASDCHIVYRLLGRGLGSLGLDWSDYTCSICGIDPDTSG
jgi:drug/metabolite transporter (DMT)-like permease